MKFPKGGLKLEKKRVIRVLLYEGEVEWLTETLANSIHGRKYSARGCITEIRGATAWFDRNAEHEVHVLIKPKGGNPSTG